MKKQLNPKKPIKPIKVDIINKYNNKYLCQIWYSDKYAEVNKLEKSAYFNLINQLENSN